MAGSVNGSAAAVPYCSMSHLLRPSRVSWNKGTGAWYACTTVGGRHRCIGHYESNSDASRALQSAESGGRTFGFEGGAERERCSDCCSCGWRTVPRRGGNNGGQ